MQYLPDICTATAGVISRPAEYDPGTTRPLLQACAAICKSCGDEDLLRESRAGHVVTITKYGSDPLMWPPLAWAASLGHDRGDS